MDDFFNSTSLTVQPSPVVDRGIVIILLVLNMLNVLLHAFGVYLLKTIQRTEDNIQYIYLTHLSICEALMNLFEGLRHIPNFLELSANQHSVNQDLQSYTKIIMFAGISLVYYFVMIYITLDRLLDILLNIKYPLYINIVKVKNLLRMTWFVALLVVVTVCFLQRFIKEYPWEKHIFKYCFPILDFGFIILSLLTYGFIFYKYLETRQGPTTIRQNSSLQRQNSAFYVFRKSRFYVSVLVIFTFLLFIVVPDLVYLFLGIIQGNESEALLATCWISYAIGNLSDWYIYIMLQPRVRKLLKKKVHLRQNRIKTRMDSRRTNLGTKSSTFTE